jgi:hypothetical protein
MPQFLQRRGAIVGLLRIKITSDAIIPRIVKKVKNNLLKVVKWKEDT